MFAWLRGLLAGGGTAADAGELAANLHYAEALGFAGATATAAVESAAGLYSRAVAGCDLSGVPPGITPIALAAHARQCLVRGESFALLMDGELIPAASVDVRGDAAGLRYQLQVQYPDAYETVTAPEARVFHARWSSDASGSWWIGRGPLQRASVTAAAVGLVEQAVKSEARIPSVSIIPMPSGGLGQDQRDSISAQIQKAVRSAHGLAFPTGTFGSAESFGTGKASAAEFAQRRIQSAPDAGLIQLRAQLTESVYHACGCSAGLFNPAAAGPSLRACWQRFVVGSVRPLCLMFSEQLRKLPGANPVWDFSPLASRSGQSFARDLQSLKAAGYSLEDAQHLLGAD